MDTKEITWEQVKALIPKTTSLYYVDYRDSLDEQHELLQDCIHSGYKDSLWEKIDDWYSESPFYAFKELDKELISDIERTFDIEEDEAKYIFEKFREDIRDTYYDRDDSDVVGDLLRNTSRMTMFYDTGYYMEPDSWAWDEKRVKNEARQIRKALGLLMKDTTWDDELFSMIRQASYGGRLVVYFYDDVENYIIPDENKTSHIRFKNPYIAVINTSNGSGDHCQLEGADFMMPFDREDVFICKTIKYSYTHDVCGMFSNWCDRTDVYFENKVSKKTKEKSSLSEHIAREKQLTETYRKGSCTPGDMDIKRHRKVIYVNNYPCGNRCEDCGTFWID